MAKNTTPEAVSDQVEHLFLVLAKGASTGDDSALRRLRMLHQAIVDREEQGETLSRLLPGGLAEKLRKEGRKIGESEELEVTVLMSDIRSYSSIAERTSPTQLAAQLNEHRAAMNRAILGAEGTVMQFVGDAVMAVFGAPFPQDDHADRAMQAAIAMHDVQRELNAGLAGQRAGGVHPRHRAVHRQGRRRAARLGGAPRVHARRRHGEPLAAPPGHGPPRQRHRAQRRHLPRALVAAGRRPVPRRDHRQGPRGAAVTAWRVEAGS